MFTNKEFEIFEIEGLEPRMQAIRQEIQPKFRKLNEEFIQELQPYIHAPLYSHIAQHRRRTANPPENTWSALSQQKRGYKMEPHFQLGIWPNYLFMYLSLIDQPKGKEQFAETLLTHQNLFTQLDEDFFFSFDHTKPDIVSVKTVDLEKELTRFKQIKKAELQIGRIIQKEHSILEKEKMAKNYMIDTYLKLLPIYNIMMKSQ